MPLVEREYLLQLVQHINATARTEAERLQALHAYLHAQEAPPHGFYDNLGSIDPGDQPHLQPGAGAQQDPASYFTPLVRGDTYDSTWPTAWLASTQTYYDARLELRYPNASGAFRARIVFQASPDSNALALGCGADTVLVEKPQITGVAELNVTLPADSRCRVGDSLVLFCQSRPAGMGGSGRGCQLSQVWLYPVAR